MMQKFREYEKCSRGFGKEYNHIDCHLNSLEEQMNLNRKLLKKSISQRIGPSGKIIFNQH